MELESPWTFQLRNPKSAALETHAGVLEFIAEEGVVYLPPWVRRAGGPVCSSRSGALTASPRLSTALADDEDARVRLLASVSCGQSDCWLTTVCALLIPRLREGDPLRVTGAKLPKGKRVKIQAQNLEFLEVSDPKAVCVGPLTRLFKPSD